MHALRGVVVRSAQRVNKWLPRRTVPRLQAPVVACCIYRARNARHVLRMLSQLPRGTEVRLHALDAVQEDLAAWTLGQGPGPRMPLLEGLIQAAALPADAWLVLFDDDTTFARRHETRFLDIAAAAGFDIAQPALDPGQPHSHELTVVRALSVARRTKFVEVGPVVALSPRSQALVLPFPPGSRMGWGVDVRWAELARTGLLSLGIVDAEPIHHHGPVGAAYALEPETALVRMALAQSGYSDEVEMLGWIRPRWWLVQHRAPWVARTAGGRRGRS